MEKPMYGYEIKSEIKKRGMDSWAKLSLPSIYNTLTRLEEKGFIKVEKEKVGKTPERNIYHITEKGKKELAHLVEENIVNFETVDYPFMLGAFFIKGLKKDKAVNALKKRKIILNKQIKHLKREIESQKNLNIPLFLSAMIEFGHNCLKEERKFVQKLIKMLKDENRSLK